MCLVYATSPFPRQSTRDCSLSDIRHVKADFLLSNPRRLDLVTLNWHQNLRIQYPCSRSLST